MFEFTVPILPLDIVENIVDILVNDAEGLKYVKAFSLTCQSFLPFCRKHIFSSIWINLGKGGSFVGHPLLLFRGEMFEQLLLETPAIAKYVRKLTIRMIQQSYWSEYSFDQVPQRLTRLESLTISFWHIFQDDSNDWNNISSSVQRSLLNLIRLPTLNHLGVKTIKNFPLSVFTSYTNIKHLSFEDTHVTGEHDEASSPSHKPIQPQSLHLKMTGSQILELLAARRLDRQPVLDLTRLEKATVCFSDDWVDAAVPTREIFSKAHRLTDINLKVDGTDLRATELATMIMPSLKTLRRIELKVIIDSLGGDPLGGLFDVLHNISGKNQLESICVHINIQPDSDYCTGAEWGRLEKVLLTSGWPMLKHVSLVVALNIWGGIHFDNLVIQSLLQTQFAGLMASKNLYFQLSVCEEWRN